jgi:hypothetical protein
MSHRFVARRAGWRCEYCLAPEYPGSLRFQVEHIISEVGGGSHDESNWALSCPSCNTYKGPVTEGRDSVTEVYVALFNPRTHVWSEHFAFDAETRTIAGLTTSGRVAVSALRMNSLRQRRARKFWMAWGWPEKSRP